VRWVLVRDPKDKLTTRAFFSPSTDVEQSAVSIAEDFIKRWNIEVTFEESRRHLGIETQCQWNDLEIAPLLRSPRSGVLKVVRRGIA
jgi:hypothetical protein